MWEVQMIGGIATLNFKQCGMMGFVPVRVSPSFGELACRGTRAMPAGRRRAGRVIRFTAGASSGSRGTISNGDQGGIKRTIDPNRCSASVGPLLSAKNPTGTVARMVLPASIVAYVLDITSSAGFVRFQKTT
ncbi:unnamed protein product [Hapterophycus canaliculatus]